MSLDRVLDHLRGLDGVLELAPQPGGDHPEISWGDHFFYHAPDGRVPTTRQPYATVVTKDYPDDTASRLDPPDRWRLNVHVGAEVLASLADPSADPAEADAFAPHPLYGAHGWVSVVCPGPRTVDRVLELLTSAHADDRRRAERRRAERDG